MPDPETGSGNGAEGARTPDLCNANAALSQLSYSPFRERESRGKMPDLQGGWGPGDALSDFYLGGRGVAAPGKSTTAGATAPK